MARNVGFDINVSADTAQVTKTATAVERLADRLQGTQRASAAVTAATARAGDQVDDLGDEASQAARAVDNLGDQMDQASGSASRLDAALAATRDRHAELLRQLDATGDVSLLPEIRGEAGVLRQLKRLRSELDGVNAAADGVSDAIAEVGEGVFDSIVGAAQGIPRSVGEAIAAGGPAILVPVAAIGVAMATTLSAAIAGVFVGGVGLGALALGVYEALSLAEAEVERFKTSLASELTDIGVPFRQPLIAAMADIERAVKGLDLKGAFAPLAAVVGPLTGDLIEMGQAAMPGIRQALEAAVPFITQVGDELPKLGEAMGDFAESMADAGPAATTLFTGLIDGASEFVSGSGEVISVLAQIYGAYQDLSGSMPYDILDPGNLALTPFKFAFDAGESINIGSDAFKDLEKHLRTIPPAADAASAALDTTASSTTQLGSALTLAQEAINALRDSMVESAGSAMAADEAELRYQKSVDKLTESLEDNGRSFDNHTAKGQANRQALIDAAQAAASIYDAMMRAESGTAAATEAYRANIAELERSMLAANMTQAQIDALIGKYRLVPPAVSTTVTADTKGAEADVGRITTLLDRIRDKLVTLTVRTVREEVDLQEQQRYGSGYAAQTRASGGWTRPGPVLLGEEGPELIWETKPRWVSTAAETARMLASPTGGGPIGSAQRAGTGTVINLTVNALDPRQAASSVMDALQAWERSNGSGWRA